MRGRVSNAVLVVAAGFAVVLVLVGCGGGEKDASGPPTPISTPTTPSPGESSSGSGSPAPARSGPVTPPKVPAAAQQRTEAGAIAFLTFYYEEVNRGSIAPGTVDLFAISHPECRACRNIQEAMQEYVDEGVYNKEKPVQVLDAALYAPASSEVPNAERVVIQFTFKQLAVSAYRGETKVSELEEGPEVSRAALRWIDGAWEMFDLEYPNA